MTSDLRLLVTGASGQLGRRVIHHLLNTLRVPPHRVIATTRRFSELSELRSLGLDVRAADFSSDLGSLVRAFRGASRMLLVSTNQLGAPRASIEEHEKAIKAAVRSGVSHIVYTSMPSPDSSLVSFAPDHAASEAALAESELSGWTVLRNQWYFENWFRSIPVALRSGRWYSAAGEGKLANISRDDIARAAAAVLASADSSRQTYTLSGAQAYTTHEIAAVISSTLGKRLAVVDVSIEKMVRGMMAYGLSKQVALDIASFDANAAAGGFADTTHDYQTITGQEPQHLADWCAANRSALLGM